MAKESILKIVFRLLTLPLILLSNFAYFINWRGFRRDVGVVVSTVDKVAFPVPMRFVYALFLAEDHRSELHPGVDPIALLRAVWVWLRWRRWEGGSTVEQQFVRTVLRMYTRSFSRKIREQLLALAVSKRRSKASIAIAYLSVAYYGTTYVGMVGLSRLCSNNLDSASSEQILGIVARLKYPEPAQPTTSWLAKYTRRVAYIARRQICLTSHSRGVDSSQEWSQVEVAQLLRTP